MTKRVLSLIIALILPITLLCGCSAKQLTGDEYQDEVIAVYKDWGKAVDDWGAYWSENIMTETPDRQYDTEFQKIQEHKPELEKILNSAEDALDKIDKIGNPPAEPVYEDLNEQLKNSILIERDWLSLQREVISVSSVDEYKAAIDNFTTHAKETIGKDLSTVYFKMGMEWGVKGGNKDWISV